MRFVVNLITHSAFNIHTHSRLTALCPGLPLLVGTWYQKKHSPIHTHEEEEEEERITWTTRSIAWELIPFSVLEASEG